MGQVLGSGFGGQGMTVGQIIANSAPPEIRRQGANGWEYIQLTGEQGNGTHITVRPSGIADHVTTRVNGLPVQRTDLR
ncbi:MAG: hypothetical protein FLDDKLPJ_03666 [Phycisphaerae bacterium]|nr:hypothetical protein [Phycisphaerae bacterium]